MLLDEKPLMVMPKLAQRIGLNEAIVLQQIHYWNEINRQAKNNYRDGHYWTFNSYEQWGEQFPFWSTRTIRRTISSLEKQHLVVAGNYNKLGIDNTKWYRIDYEVLETLENKEFHVNSSCGQNGQTTWTKWPDDVDKLTRPLPETNTETNTETNKKILLDEGSGEVTYSVDRTNMRLYGLV